MQLHTFTSDSQNIALGVLRKRDKDTKVATIDAIHMETNDRAVSKVTKEQVDRNTLLELLHDSIHIDANFQGEFQKDVQI